MRLLDLFCGAGGAAMGYYRAGFTEIVGIDLKPQPRYPFRFVQADAMQPPVRLEYFDAIHASPPCQKYSWSARRWRDVQRTDLVEPTRALLIASGLPWVMENVIGAPLAKMLTLCGTQFGLEVLRHRRFESNVLLFSPGRCWHAGSVGDGTYVTVAGHGGNNIKGRGSRAAKQRAMGIDWMNDRELNESIPPAYTEFIGRQLLQSLHAEVA
jgi:DNA (cytosine-5)-methyltransferase 1